ncbi:hypothetical protein [Martelella sp. HB161492]|uniref:hypothetical protein n=1 Tax=Martelella sp. HB161492 TaxID=2720726 RepID=UPI00159176D9|nr:hypothetical protein [Martelella sp. HB161492]
MRASIDPSGGGDGGERRTWKGGAMVSSIGSGRWMAVSTGGGAKGRDDLARDPASLT